MKAPSKVAFFTWTATKGNILTLDNLRKRNISVINWCCMCTISWGLVDHFASSLFLCHIVCGHLCLACLVSRVKL